MRHIPPLAPCVASLVIALTSPACNHPARYLTPIPEADPRNFSWTVDTIAYPGSPATLMKSIWGSSLSDIYVAGRNDLTRGTMFHYNGILWAPVKLTAAEGGTIEGTIDLSQVLGFTVKDVYAVGGKTPSAAPQGGTPSSLVIHFDGSSWTEVQVPARGMLRSVWGVYNGSVWAAGSNGTVIRSEGSAWLSAYVPDTVSFTSVSGVSADNVYALASRFTPGGLSTVTRYLWHWNGGVWGVADSFAQRPGEPERFGSRALWSLLAIVYTAGEGLYKMDGGSWDQLMPPGTGGSFNAVYGTTSSSLFVAGDGGGVYYLDPYSAYRYSAFTDPGINYEGAWTDGREVFIVGHDALRSYVLHGK